MVGEAGAEIASCDESRFRFKRRTHRGLQTFGAVVSLPTLPNAGSSDYRAHKARGQPGHMENVSHKRPFSDYSSGLHEPLRML
jgi:hypothetical protein